uniref:DNA-directed RNA polymerase n=1 Tax=Carteria sp. SAG 8-5 TaxID=1756294 RepID=A0A0S2LQ54_9CHLO|nr:beta subunit of RNA polymerase [Carteria sp. SAG 8-5]
MLYATFFFSFLKKKTMITQSKYYISDFIDIQRKSFQDLLEKGLIQEFLKRNPISDTHLEVFFYPEFYQLSPPDCTTREAILKGKSYSSKLYIPVQLTDKKSKKILLKWVLIGELPIMTKRGNFILNGAPRVIVNQLIRSPGIYYQEKKLPVYANEKDEKPFATLKRYYADFICLRGTWLRIEIDKDKNIWAQFKKGPKMPLLWLLYAMGLSEGMILKCTSYPARLLINFENENRKLNKISPLRNRKTEKNKNDLSTIEKKKTTSSNFRFLKSPREAWKEIAELFHLQRDLPLKETNNKNVANYGKTNTNTESPPLVSNRGKEETYISKDERLKESQSSKKVGKSGDSLNLLSTEIAANTRRKTLEELGRKWIYNKFMNPRNYDLGKQGRHSFNRKLGLTISPFQTTLTPQDVLYATDYLLKVEKGFKDIDDIDNLMNRRIRTSGELIQMQIGIGLVRLEKTIREKLKNQIDVETFITTSNKKKTASKSQITKFENKEAKQDIDLERLFNNLINSKVLNGALREFFGTNPLSQFMDQINPLAEITHKRRLSSMGPGGVGRENAPMAIRSIHPTHYGRICPIETPEGKNTGLVNSLTTCARVTTNGFIETPFYKVFKGQVQKNAGIFYLTTEQEEKIKSAPADLSISSVGFLPKSTIPVRFATEFTKIQRNEVQFIGISPIQMISVATSLIPFLEHDDANRALMGSNMQRQAVPIIRPQRPIVGTGLESRAASDSGHVIQCRTSGFVGYVSADKILIYTSSAGVN